MNGIRLLFSAGIGIVAVTTALAASPVAPRPQPQVEYSADSYMETEQLTMKSKVYHSAGKERKEQEMGGEKQVTIMRMDKQLLWTVMPSQQMYMEMSLQGKQRPPGPSDDTSNYTYERTEVGPDVVAGHQTTKYKVIATNPKGEKMGGFLWVTREGIQIKMDLVALVEGSKTRMKTGLTNLKIGKQDPSLFEVPANYTKMMMPGFGGRGGPGASSGNMPNTQMPPTQRPNLPTQEEVSDEAAAETEGAGDAVQKGIEDEGINRFKGLFGR
jgi:hypothetical protein